ncbi:acyl-CoA dehydrogenase family protein [Pradoshia sp.]
MVSFKPSDEEMAFIHVAKDFAMEFIRPAARETERNRKVSEEIVKKLGEIGMDKLELPESFGGMELPILSQVQILEELAYGDLDTVQGLPGAGESAAFIREAGDHPAFTSYKKACQAGSVPTIAFCHPNQPKLTISQLEDSYSIAGETVPLRMGKYADYVLLLGKEQNGEEVIIWLENGPDTPFKAVDGDYRLGLLSAGFASLSFQNVIASKEAVLARGSEASELASRAMSRIRVMEAAKEVGITSGALDYTVDYTASRKAFGSEIAKFQGVSFNVAQMAIHVKGARHLVLYAAKQIDEGAADAAFHSIQALKNAHRSVRFVTDSAVQLLGGHGYVQDHPVEKWMRDGQAQVAWFEQEHDLNVYAGDWLLNKAERGEAGDLVRTVSTSSPS